MDEQALKNIFAVNLKELLHQKGYTQEQFINELNTKYHTEFKRNSVSEWTRAKKIPRPIIVQNIGELFGKDAGWMLTNHQVSSKEDSKNTYHATVYPIQNNDQKTKIINIPEGIVKDDEIELFKYILDLSDSQKTALKMFIDALKN